MKNTLLLKIIAAILLAVLAGWAAGPESSFFGITFVRIFDLLGKLFLNALTLVVVPLVVSSIITGTSRLGSEQTMESLGIKTFQYFILTSILAVMIGMIVALVFQPGANQGEQLLSPSNSETLSQLEQHAQGDNFDKLQQILFRIIPKNILEAASQGQILGVILFSMLFGYFTSKIPEESSKVLMNFWRGVFQVMMLITHLVMRLMPIGVFGLVAKVVATTGMQSFLSAFYFLLVVLLALALHMFVTLPLLLKLIGGIDPRSHFRAMAPALITAFSTSSSAASLPVTIECLEDRAGVSNRISSFTLPLGSAMNLQGTALYCSIAILFIVQAYAVPVTFTMLALIFLMCVLSSLGMVAGVPSASIITIVLILQTLDLPSEGIVLLLSVERLLDMCRTTVSVFGNSCCARLVAVSQNLANRPAPL